MKPNKFNITNKKDRAEFIDNFWLNLGEVHNIKTGNIIGKHKLFQDNPPLAIVDLMSQPENFAWTVSVLFNIETHPLQSNILKTLWNHPFSILMAGRGGSKSFCLGIYAMLRALFIPNTKVMFIGNAFRQSKIIFNYCENIYYKSPMLQDILGNSSNKIINHNVDMFQMKIYDSTITSIPLGDGCLSGNTLVTYNDGIKYINHDLENKFSRQIVLRDAQILTEGNLVDSDEAYCNGVTDTIKITTHKGFQLEGTPNHQIKVKRNNVLQLVRLDSLKNSDKILIDRSIRWFNNHNNVDDNEAYCLGLLIGDGCWVNKYKIGFATKDVEFMDYLKKDVHFNGTKFNGIWKQSKDIVHWSILGKDLCKNYLDYWNIPPCYTIDKYIPQKMLSASKKSMSALLSGIFDTDGTINIGNKDGACGITVSLTNTSKKLIDQIHYILTHYGIVAYVKGRKRGENHNVAYELLITGKDVLTFFHEIGFRLKRKKQKLLNAINRKKRFLSNNRDEYYYYDKIKNIENGKCCTYDLHVPKTHLYTANSFIVHNTKIRGQRSTCTISDEHNSLNEEIYQEVIQGFSAVSLNPIQQVKERAKYRAMLELGEIDEEKFQKVKDSKVSNQQIISGTCGYVFQPLYKVWKKYHDIILSKGDEKKIKQIFNDELPSGFSYKDFAICRFPQDIYPESYIDEKSIGKAKATTHSGIYNSEYMCCFVTDSQGFFKRTLIENATCGRALTKLSKKCGDIDFTIMMEGNPTGKYVMGVDPASQADNFAIVILEIWEDHRRIVHSWTTNNNAHKLRLKYGLIKEHDYYRHCARKIRLFMKLFNIAEISIDAQGGGRAIAEILGDPSHLESGEHPLYPVVDIAKPLSTDYLEGLHILHLIEFSNAEWTYNANHNLKQDIETRELLFPACSSADFGLLHDMDVLTNRIQDEAQEIGDLRETAEDVLLEIEELKNELVLIEHTKTASGRDRWDTPQIKGLNSKKGRLRKDRYSALLMANAIGRMSIARTIEYEYDIMGGFAKNLVSTADRIKAKEVPDVSAGFSFGVGVKRR